MKPTVIAVASLAFALACGAKVDVEDDDGGQPAAEPSTCESDGECPDGSTCDELVGLCAVDDGPCGGLSCGGSERGTCLADDTCECLDGHAGGVIDHVCCEVDGSDPLCDVEPAPGRPGGLCLGPDGHCDAGILCVVDLNYCLDEAHPCLGFSCGGVDRGQCSPDAGRPMCTCNPGFDNTQFALYCCPTDGSDPTCTG